MWKRIVIYIIILIILLGLYFLFTPQATNGPQAQKAGEETPQNLNNKTSGFQGPTGPPSATGPSGPPPQQ